jgi:hypothetical protein
MGRVTRSPDKFTTSCPFHRMSASVSCMYQEGIRRYQCGIRRVSVRYQEGIGMVSHQHYPSIMHISIEKCIVNCLRPTPLSTTTTMAMRTERWADREEGRAHGGRDEAGEQIIEAFSTWENWHVNVSIAAVFAFMAIGWPATVRFTGIAGWLKFRLIPWLGCHFWVILQSILPLPFLLVSAVYLLVITVIFVLLLFTGYNLCRWELSPWCTTQHLIPHSRASRIEILLLLSWEELSTVIIQNGMSVLFVILAVFTLPIVFSDYEQNVI